MGAFSGKIFDKIFDRRRQLKASVFSVLLRGLTLFSKFFLVVYLAKQLSAAEVGAYGLFLATIGYVLYFLGLDFYTYSSREWLKSEQAERTGIIRDQFAFYLVTYVLFLPAFFLLFLGDILEWKYIVWFYAILVLEHIGQELYRLLTVVQLPVRANLCLFIRSGVWVYMVAMYMWWDEASRDLSVIWIGWIIGSSLSILLALSSLHKAGISFTSTAPVNWRWIRRGVMVAIPFLLSSLALRGIFVVDRYFLKVFDGNDAVGVYTFYMNIASAVYAFIEAGVIVHYFPKIVLASNGKGEMSLTRLNRQMLSAIGIASVALVVFVYILIDPVLGYIGHDVYAESLPILWWLIAGMILFSVSSVPHYHLYAVNKDSLIIFSAVLSFVTVVFAGLLWIPIYGVNGAAYAVSLGMVVLLASKLAAVLYVNRRTMVGC